MAATIAACGACGLVALADEPEAMVASGTVIFDTSVTRIEPPAEGILAEIRTRDGDRVAAGDVVARLDDIFVRAKLAQLDKDLDALVARKGRLEAEWNGAEAISFPDSLTKRAGDPEVERAVAGERKAFEARRAIDLSQRDLLRYRIRQFEDQVRGFTAQAQSKEQEISLIERQLELARGLRAKNLMPVANVTALERDIVRLEGERQGWLVASVADARAKISETELQILSLDRDHRNEAARELRETERQLADCLLRRAAVEDELRRLEIRAPHDGLVRRALGLAVGSPVAPGTEILRIVAQSRKATIEARFPSRDVEPLRIGQSAALRLAALNQGTDGSLNGTLDRISLEAAAGEQSDQTYYTVHVAPLPEEAARIDFAKLDPGASVEVVINPHKPTLLAGLVQPLVHVVKPFGERIRAVF